MFHISEVDKYDGALAVLIGELDAFQGALYPTQSQHCPDFSTLSEARLRCIVARDERGAAAGCGALLLQDGGEAELKRVYIRPAYRGRGLGEQIVGTIEGLASASGCRRLRLETGIYQQPAIALYRRCGYRPCAAFPPYEADPLSVFMVKAIG